MSNKPLPCRKYRIIVPETKNGHIFSGIVTFVDTYDRLAQMPKTKTILKSVTGNTQGAATSPVSSTYNTFMVSSCVTCVTPPYQQASSFVSHSTNPTAQMQ